MEMIKKLVFFILFFQVAFGKHIFLDNNHHSEIISANTGDKIIVKLTGEISNKVTWSWSIPKSSDSKHLHSLYDKQWTNGDVFAVFQVEESGSSDITASRRCVPKPDIICNLAILLWKVTVNVA